MMGLVSLWEETRELAHSLCHVRIQLEGCHRLLISKKVLTKNLTMLAPRLLELWETCLLSKPSCPWYSIIAAPTSTWPPFSPWNIIRKQIKYAFPIHLPYSKPLTLHMSSTNTHTIGAQISCCYLRLTSTFEFSQVVECYFGREHTAVVPEQTSKI